MNLHQSDAKLPGLLAPALEYFRKVSTNHIPIPRAASLDAAGAVIVIEPEQVHLGKLDPGKGYGLKAFNLGDVVVAQDPEQSQLGIAGRELPYPLAFISSIAKHMNVIWLGESKSRLLL